jgi:long-subunit acyl-CoA synthetase (AMP-forming)
MIDDSECQLMLVHGTFLKKGTEVASSKVVVVDVASVLVSTKDTSLSQLSDTTSKDAGVLVYTSGTTSRPVSRPQHLALLYDSLT